MGTPSTLPVVTFSVSLMDRLALPVCEAFVEDTYELKFILFMLTTTHKHLAAFIA